MNEKYTYGICHVCSCAIAIPGFEAYYCSSCQKWLAYSNSKKFNFSSQTLARTNQRNQPVNSPEQISINLSGDSQSLDKIGQPSTIQTNCGTEKSNQKGCPILSNFFPRGKS